jgi:hypothetical protein
MNFFLYSICKILYEIMYDNDWSNLINHVQFSIYQIEIKFIKYKDESTYCQSFICNKNIC